MVKIEQQNPQNRFQSRRMNVFTSILETVPTIDAKNHQSAKNITANAVKPVSKLVREHFCLYHDSPTFDRLNVNSKELKIKHQEP